MAKSQNVLTVLGYTAKPKPTQPRKKKAKPGQSVGGDLQGSNRIGKSK